MNNTIEYKGYIGSVEFSEADSLLYGKVPLYPMKELRFRNLLMIFMMLLTIILPCVKLMERLLRRPLREALMSGLRIRIFTREPPYMRILTA